MSEIARLVHVVISFTWHFGSMTCSPSIYLLDRQLFEAGGIIDGWLALGDSIVWGGIN
jgi:hypothetical protein